MTNIRNYMWKVDTRKPDIGDKWDPYKREIVYAGHDGRLVVGWITTYRASKTRGCRVVIMLADPADSIATWGTRVSNVAQTRAGAIRDVCASIGYTWSEEGSPILELCKYINSASRANMYTKTVRYCS